MPPAGFKPAIPAGDRPQTLALDRSATGIGNTAYLLVLKYVKADICITITAFHHRNLFRNIQGPAIQFSPLPNPSQTAT
jgi:hypothetical protein